MKVLGEIIGVLTLLGMAELRIKALVKSYLSELKPNGGSSAKDQITRLEAKVETILQMLSK